MGDISEHSEGMHVPFADSSESIVNDTQAQLTRLKADMHMLRSKYKEASDRVHKQQQAYRGMRKTPAGAVAETLRGHIPRSVVRQGMRARGRILNWDKTEYFHILCRSLADKLYLSMHYRALRCGVEMGTTLRLFASRRRGLSEHNMKRQFFDALVAESKRRRSTRLVSGGAFRLWTLDRGLRRLRLRCALRARLALLAAESNRASTQLRRCLALWKSWTDRRCAGAGESGRLEFSALLQRRSVRRLSGRPTRYISSKSSLNSPDSPVCVHRSGTRASLDASNATKETARESLSATTALCASRASLSISMSPLAGTAIEESSELSSKGRERSRSFKSPLSSAITKSYSDGPYLSEFSVDGVSLSSRSGSSRSETQPTVLPTDVAAPKLSSAIPESDSSWLNLPMLGDAIGGNLRVAPAKWSASSLASARIQPQSPQKAIRIDMSVPNAAVMDEVHIIEGCASPNGHSDSSRGDASSTAADGEDASVLTPVMTVSDRSGSDPFKSLSPSAGTIIVDDCGVVSSSHSGFKQVEKLSTASQSDASIMALTVSDLNRSDLFVDPAPSEEAVIDSDIGQVELSQRLPVCKSPPLLQTVGVDVSVLKTAGEDLSAGGSDHEYCASYSYAHAYSLGPFTADENSINVSADCGKLNFPLDLDFNVPKSASPCNTASFSSVTLGCAGDENTVSTNRKPTLSSSVHHSTLNLSHFDRSMGVSISPEFSIKNSGSALAGVLSSFSSASVAAHIMNNAQLISDNSTYSITSLSAQSFLFHNDSQDSFLGEGLPEVPLYRPDLSVSQSDQSIEYIRARDILSRSVVHSDSCSAISPYIDRIDDCTCFDNSDGICIADSTDNNSGSGLIKGMAGAASPHSSFEEVFDSNLNSTMSSDYIENPHDSSAVSAQSCDGSSLIKTTTDYRVADLFNPRESFRINHLLDKFAPLCSDLGNELDRNCDFTISSTEYLGAEIYCCSGGASNTSSVNVGMGATPDATAVLKLVPDPTYRSKRRQERSQCLEYIGVLFKYWVAYIFVDRHKIYKLSYYMQQKRYHIAMRSLQEWKKKVKKLQLLRRVFGRALELYDLRMELTCTNYRLLKYVLFGWVTVTQKWKRVRKRGDAHRRALVFRGASLLSRMFHAWSRASSRRRRKKEACERYTLLVFKISFYLWKTTSLESARIRRRASRMRGDRVLKAVIHNWREFVRIKCVDIPQRVLSVLRLRMLFGHWRTLKRVLLLKTTVFDSALWKVKRTANVFKKWLFLLVRKRSIQKACHMLQRCKGRYRLRCSLLRWEGWEEERLAQRLWSSLQDRRLKPIATVTLNGSLINSWEQHILSWRWREGAVANESSDDGYQEIVKYHELMMTTEADSESAEAQSRLHHLFSASTGVSRRPNRHELINRIGEPEKKEKANTREKGYHGSLSSLKSVQKKDSTKSFSCKKIHSQNIRCSILDRALLLGYCNYRPESHAPLLKCLKAILQAFRKIVRKRRHSHVAYIYYRNNRHHATVSSSFHFWISKIPELSHRSSSWLHSLPEGRPLLSVS